MIPELTNVAVPRQVSGADALTPLTRDESTVHVALLPTEHGAYVYGTVLEPTVYMPSTMYPVYRDVTVMKHGKGTAAVLLERAGSRRALL